MSRGTQAWRDAYGIDVPEEGYRAIGCGKFVVDVPLTALGYEDLGQRLMKDASKLLGDKRRVLRVSLYVEYSIKKESGGF